MKRRLCHRAVLLLGVVPGLTLLAPVSLGAEPSDTIRSLRADPPGADDLLARLDEAFSLAEDEEKGGGPDRGVLALAHLDAAGLLVERGISSEALGHFREADRLGEDPAVRAAARFNYAQTRFRLAVGAARPSGEDERPDYGLALEHLRAAASAFRAVLDIAPDDLEAARNTERVRRMISAFEHALERARERAERLREQAERLEQLADRQQRESVENGENAQPGEEAIRDQGDLSEETRRLSSQMQENQADPSAMEQMRGAMDQQNRAEGELGEGDPTEASEAQLRAAQRLRQAARALREQADQADGGEESEQEQQGEPREGEEGEPGDQEGESQADRVSQWLLDREQRTREQRDRQIRAIRGRTVPVEKDW